jgi:hypothetical protein
MDAVGLFLITLGLARRSPSPPATLVAASSSAEILHLTPPKTELAKLLNLFFLAVYWLRAG